MKFLFFFGSLFLLLTFQTLGNEKLNDVILVLDASGSMWGKIQGKTKIEIARETITEMAKEWDNEVALGLVVYGHRKKKDCKDIETLIKVGKMNQSSFIKTIQSINPKGKTPLGDSVLHAANELGFKKNKATVIAVSDGEETCGQDLCKLGVTLKKRGVDFKVHVVGFDIQDPKKQKGLRCLAKNTGGEYFSPKNANELKDSLKKATLKSVGIKTGARFKSFLKKGSPILKQTTWKVFRENQDPKTDKPVQWKAYSTSPFIKLAPGKYKVTAENGASKGYKTFEIKKNEVQEVLVYMESGTVIVTAKLSEDSKKNLGTTTFKIHDKKSNKTLSWKAYVSSAKFVVPAGDYILEANHMQTNLKEPLSISAGDNLKKVLILNAGKIKTYAALAKGGKAIDTTTFKVYSEEEFKKDTPKPIGYQAYQRAASFTLPVGRYHLEASNGVARKVVKVETELGKEIEKVIILEAGRLEVKARFKGKGDLNYTAWSIKNQTGKSITGKAYSKNGTFVLPAGTYNVIATNKDKQAEQKVEIKAGNTNRLDLEF